MAVDLNFVTDRLATGAALASVDDAAFIAALGITHVVDARAELDDAPFFAAQPSISYLWNPTEDDGGLKPPDYWRKTLEFALPALARPHTRVYLHCAAGINRGPSNALCVLVALGWTGDEAQALIKAVRPQAQIAYEHDAIVACSALGYA